MSAKTAAGMASKMKCNWPRLHVISPPHIETKYWRMRVRYCVCVIDGRKPKETTVTSGSENVVSSSSIHCGSISQLPATSGFDGFRNLPEFLFVQIFLKRVEKGKDLFIFVDLVVVRLFEPSHVVENVELLPPLGEID